MIGVREERRLSEDVAQQTALQDESMPLFVVPDKLYFAFDDLKHVLDSITLVEQVATFAKHTLG